MTSQKIIILFGGASAERRVSVASGQNLSATLPDATLWFLNPHGAIYEISPASLARHDRPFETDFIPPVSATFQNLDSALASARDSVFLLGLHGGEGEDGTLQKKFEAWPVAFTGSGALASKKAFDKVWAKKLAVELGIRTAPQLEINAGQGSETTTRLTEFFMKHRQVIIKPVAGGSSIGLFRLHEQSQIAPIVEEINQQKGCSFLAETFVAGKEITVGIFEEGKNLVALPPSEVRLDPNCAFDYEGKYLGKGSLEITPAEISVADTQACQKLAQSIHQTLGCFGYSRTDIIIGEQGPVFLEINTLPGLTRASFIPQQLTAANIPFADFLTSQVRQATERRRNP
jgi:D-alanine-D-alanine ligase